MPSFFFALSFPRPSAVSRHSVPIAGIAAAGLLASLLAGCGHVPLLSLPKLMKIDFETTALHELRAAVLVPEQIKPAPKGVTMTVTVVPATGGKHERNYALELITDPVELTQLPPQVPGKTRLLAYRLNQRDAAQLDAFRQEMQAMRQQSGQKGKGAIGISANKMCQTGPLPGGPLHMTSYLKTSETGEYVVAASNVDLREMATSHKIDLATAIPPCPAE